MHMKYKMQFLVSEGAKKTNFFLEKLHSNRVFLNETNFRLTNEHFKLRTNQRATCDECIHCFISLKRTDFLHNNCA